MKKFNDDDICRDLPPDVMGLIHDIAYMDRRSVKGNIVERAQEILREPSDGDIRAQLQERETFMLLRAIDAMCSLCEHGEDVEMVHSDVAGGYRFLHKREGVATRYDCVAYPIHQLLAIRRAQEACAVFELTKGGADMDALNCPTEAQLLTDALMDKFHVVDIMGDHAESDKGEVLEFVSETLSNLRRPESRPK